MRIAVSGAHATGKSTLIAELRRLLPSHEAVDEPYYALLEAGSPSAGEPCREDFEAQLEASIGLITGHGGPDVLFERCPVDYLAYLRCLPGAADDVSRWMDESAPALASLDRIVFVPVERPDRVHVGASEGRRLRRRVDALLREILVDDGWGLGLAVVEVHGSPSERAQQVLRATAMQG